MTCELAENPRIQRRADPQTGVESFRLHERLAVPPASGAQERIA